jgi:uncharacterized protein YqfB (UPF0267 family)
MKSGDKVKHVSGHKYSILSIAGNTAHVIDAHEGFYAGTVPLDMLKPVEDGHYLCWVQGKSEPKVQHPTLTEAQAEAERLARLEGRKVTVMKVVGVATPETTVKWEAM